MQALIVEENTDISNIRQFSFCIRTMNKTLDIEIDTIVTAIKDILIRFHLKLDKWWEKILMLGNKSLMNNLKQ